MSTPSIRQAVAVATTGGASATVTLGASTAVGDLLLIYHGNDFDTTANMPTPTTSQTVNTKTLQATVDNGISGNGAAHIKFWTAVTTVAGSQTVTCAPTASGEEVSAQVVVIDGSTVDTSTTTSFLDGTVGTNTGNTLVTAHVAPAVSPTTSDALLICVVQSSGNDAGGGSAAITYTVPSGMTSRTGVNDGTFEGAATASLVLSASGSTGTKTFTSSAIREFAALSVAIKGSGSAAAPAVGMVTARERHFWPGRGPRCRNRFHATRLDTIGPQATAAPADVTLSTGTAYDATVSTVPTTSAPADIATGTGTAYDASVGLAATGDQATGTGTAYDAAVSSATPADANQAWPGVAPMFFDPPAASVQLAGSTARVVAVSAPADVASGTGTGYDASVAVAVTADQTTATGTAYDASTALAASAGSASATATSAIVTRQGATLYRYGQPFTFGSGVNLYYAAARSPLVTAGGPRDLGSANGKLATALGTLDTASGGKIKVFRFWAFQNMAVTSGARDWAAIDQAFAVANSLGWLTIPTLADEFGNMGDGGALKTVTWFTGDYENTVGPNDTVTYKAWVSEFAARYKNEPSILYVNFINEGSPYADTSFGLLADDVGLAVNKTWARDIADTYRAQDPVHLLCNGLNYNNSGTKNYTTNYEDIIAYDGTDIFVLHDYAGDTANIDSASEVTDLVNLRLKSVQANKPFVVEEVGVHITAGASRSTDYDSKFTRYAVIPAGQSTSSYAGALPWVWNDSLDTNGSYSVIDSVYDIRPDVDSASVAVLTSHGQTLPAGPVGAPTVAIAPTAGNAAATGTAYDATVTTSGSTSVAADIATGTGTAYDAAVALGVTAGNAAGTGTAYDATVSTVANTSAPADVATGTGTAYDATTSGAEQAAADIATGTGTAYDATVSTSSAGSANADQATATGTAYDASSGIAVTAGNAAATGTAYDATASSASFDNAPADVATGTGTAYDATTSGAQSSPADVATGTGTAYDASVGVAAGAGLASATGTAYDATVSTLLTTLANADVATGTAAAFDALVKLAVTADVATGTGAAFDIASSVPAPIKVYGSTSLVGTSASTSTVTTTYGSTSAVPS